MYRKRLNIDEVKSIELEILRYVKDICNANKLRYYLCAGTLLGAVRHKGFIPWDDDIDIALPRNDYMKLIDILKNDHRYGSLSIYNNKDYYYPFAKIVDTSTILIEHTMEYPIEGLGVYIDVFPIDGLPQNNIIIRYHMNKLKIFRKMLFLSLKRDCPKSSNAIKYIIKYVVWIFSKIIGWRKLIRYVERLGTKYDYNNGDKVGCIVSGYYEKEIVNKEVFEDSVDLEFEGVMFPAPIGYEEYLTSLYGDYMKLPPEEERVYRHSFDAFLK